MKQAVPRLPQHAFLMRRNVISWLEEYLKQLTFWAYVFHLTNSMEQSPW